jgi:hypothetical protein
MINDGDEANKHLNLLVFMISFLINAEHAENAQRAQSDENKETPRNLCVLCEPSVISGLDKNSLNKRSAQA